MEARVTSIKSVAEALMPAVENLAAQAEAAGDAPAAAFLRSSGASDEVALKVIETVERRLPAEPRRELNLLLRLMGSRLGSMLLLGRAAFSGFGLPQAFTSLPLDQRAAVLLSWAISPDPRMRKAFKALKSLIVSAQFTHLSPDGSSDFLAAIGYPIVDPERPPAPAPPAVAAEAAVAAALVDLSAHDGSPGSAAGAGAALAAKGLRVAWPGDFGAAAVAREKPQLSIQCDVVVVGSGAGGGPAAANLAQAGLRVVVLERAGFVPAQKMTLQEGEAFQTMYEQGGILSTEDGAMSVLAGATLGGGTRINWCASFRTPPHVRKEWAEQHGLPDFASDKYEQAMDAVCSRVSVHTGFKHSPLCSTLARGLQGLGVHCAEVPRNCLSADCGGHCCLGCARGYKQDSVNTWLSDACQAGARIITGAWAERVLVEPCSEADAGSAAAVPDGGQHQRRKRVAGVLVLAGSEAAPLRLAIQAPVVVTSAGSLHTPALLQRSRISCGGNVGSNLRLHPATCVVGLFPPEGPAGGGASSSGQAQAAAGGSQGPSNGGLLDLEDIGGRTAGSTAGTAGAAGAAGAGAEQPGSQGQSHRRLDMSGPAGGQGGPGSRGSIRCWEGTLMSIFSNHVGDWEGSGYGTLLYTPAVHPGLLAAAAPWIGGEDYKRLMLEYPNLCIVLVLVRDTGSGRVAADRAGRPRIHYTTSPADQEAMLKGVDLGLRCLAAAGAASVLTLTNSPEGRFFFDERFEPASAFGAAAAGEAPPAVSAAAAGQAAGAAEAGSPAGASSPAVPGAPSWATIPAGSLHGGRAEFERYLADVAAAGAAPLRMTHFSAHQMGTCRLGGDPASSALDPSGQCWEVAGLYCLDGSALPTPTGLNPMITIESISYMLSKQLADRLAAHKQAAGSPASKRQPGSGPAAAGESKL